ncbi:MAG: ABC transporter permease [bacterium]|nr:ABC transporter permease [bacterium]
MRKELGIFFLLLALCVLMGVLNPDFFTGQNLQNNARLVGMYGLISVGVGVVIVTGGIDLSIGSALALLGVLLAMMLNPQGGGWRWPWWLAVAAILVLAAALGAIHGLLVTRAGIQPFIVTLCGLLLYRGLARFIAHDASQGLGGHEGFETLSAVAAGTPGGVPTQFILFVVVAAAMFLVLHRSVFGRYLFAVGRNEEAARYSGIDSRRIILSAYVVCGVFTGLAAVLFAFYTNTVQASSHGNFYELYAIAGAVLGGCSLRGGEGSVAGIVLGTILLVVLRNVVNLVGIESSLDFAVMGGVILLGVLADQALHRRGERRRRRQSRSN